MSTRVDNVMLDRSWWSFGGPHGGYLASQLLLGIRRLTDAPPRSLHVQFLAAAREGPAHVDASVDRQGRTATCASATMTSGGTLTARAGAVARRGASGLRCRP